MTSEMSVRTSRVVLASAVGGLLTLGLGVAVPALAHASSESGATAAALDSAFYFAVGAGAGVAIASGLGSVLARPADFPIRFVTGLMSGCGAAILAVFPLVLVLNGGDVLPALAGAAAAAFLAVFISTLVGLIGAGVTAGFNRSQHGR